MDTNHKGLRAEIKVQLRALELGATVCKPIGDFRRYGLVIDWKGKLHRVQVKYAVRLNMRMDS